MPKDQSNEDSENTATVVMPENGAVVKFVSDGDIGTVDGASGLNGPTDAVPSTSVDAVVETAKTDQEKAKEEKPKVVGWLELVKSLAFIVFVRKMYMENINILRSNSSYIVVAYYLKSIVQEYVFYVFSKLKNAFVFYVF